MAARAWCALAAACAAALALLVVVLGGARRGHGAEVGSAGKYRDALSAALAERRGQDNGASMHAPPASVDARRTGDQKPVGSSGTTAVALFNRPECSARVRDGAGADHATQPGRFVRVNRSQDLCDAFFHGADLDAIGQESGQGPACGEDATAEIDGDAAEQWCAYGNVRAASIPPHTKIRLTNACTSTRDYSRNHGFLARWGDVVEIENRDDHERCFALPQPRTRGWGHVDVIKLKSPAEACSLYPEAMERALRPPGGDAALSEKERARKARMPELGRESNPARPEHEAAAGDARRPRAGRRALLELPSHEACKPRALVTGGNDTSTAMVQQLNMVTRAAYFPRKERFADVYERVCPASRRPSRAPDGMVSRTCGGSSEYSIEIATAFASQIMEHRRCGSWCVYSATEPWARGWMWEPNAQCWEPVGPEPPLEGQRPNECFFKYKSELKAAIRRAGQTGCYGADALAHMREAEEETRTRMAESAVAAPTCRAEDPDAKPDLERAAAIQKCLSYWDQDWTPPPGTMGKAAVEKALGVSPEEASKPKYVFFDHDQGGLNNIRMAFEWVVSFAVITGRILVLPPPSGWYLINFGRVKVGAGHEGGVSHFSGFFDVDFLNETFAKYGTTILNFTEFVRREGESLQMPDYIMRDFGASFTEAHDDPRRQEFRDWGFNHLTPASWSPQRGIICVPACKREWYDGATDVKMAEKMPRLPTPDTPTIWDRDGRELGEYTRDNHTREVLYFPDRRKKLAADGVGYRQFGQVAKAFWFQTDAGTVEFHRLLRSVHYPALVYEIASRVVSYLGLFEYSSMHIRRNELQYKSAFVGAEASVENTAHLLRPNETLYIASDETEPGFFQPFRRRYCVYRFSDFLGPRGGNVLADVHVPANLLGPIEQVIMASGRLFIGTRLSTFSSFVNRLRGYIGTPDTSTWYHNGYTLSPGFRYTIGGDDWAREGRDLRETL